MPPAQKSLLNFFSKVPKTPKASTEDAKAALQDTPTMAANKENVVQKQDEIASLPIEATPAAVRRFLFHSALSCI